MDNLWQDVRYAVRSLARQPTFTALAVGTLAVGIAANTIIFGAINSTLLYPMPFEGGDRFVYIQQVSPAGTMRTAPSSTAIHAWRERALSLESIATYGSEPVVVRLADEPMPARAVNASVELLPFLGTDPVRGRGFSAQDTVPGHDRVALITERFQQQWFPSDEEVLGRTITVNEEGRTIIGVVPNRATAFFGRFDQESPWDFGIWLPAANRRSNVARIRAGVAIEDATEEIRRIHEQLPFDADGADAWPPVLHQPTDYIAKDLKAGLWILLGTVGFVLTLACVNVMNMLLVRGIAREHEMSMRIALGARRSRLLRQLLAESFLLTTTATAAALGIAALAFQVGRPLLPDSLTALHQIRIDFRVLSLAAATAVLTGILFGMVPLAHVRASTLNALLTQGARAGITTRLRTRTRSILVAVQVALATILFVGAGLMTNSLLRLNARDLAFDPDNLISFSMHLPESRYPDPNARITFYQAALETIQRVPQVRTVALGGIQGFGYTEGAIVVEGKAAPYASKGMQFNLVSVGYFRALGLPLQAGRAFTAQEMRNTRGPVVINENFERTYWPGESGAGKRFRFEHSETWYTVIGVTSNIELSGLGTDPTSLVVYHPFPNMPTSSIPFTVRVTGRPADALALLKGAIWTIDGSLPLQNVEIATETIADANARPRFNALMLTAFALIGLALAVVGVYSVVALALQHRTHELGIRMALGATARDSLQLMMLHGLRPVIAGIVLGLGLAVGLSRFLKSLLFEVEPTDPATYGFVTVALMIAAFAASYIPARRASRVDPVEVLRVQ
jgi:putative ABC transport system permease protein